MVASEVKGGDVTPSRFLLLCGIFGSLTCLCQWSGFLVIVRPSMTGGLSIIDLAFLRYGVAFLAVSPFMWKFWPRHLALRWQLVIALCSAGLPYSLLSYAGLQRVEVADAGIFQNGFIPVMTAFFIYLHEGKLPTWRGFVGIFIIMCGSLALSLRNGGGSFSFSFDLGHLYLFLSACIISFYVLILPRMGVNLLQVLVLVTGINGVLALILWLFLGSSDIVSFPIEVLLLQGLYQGLGPSLLGVGAFYLGILYFGKIRTASVMAGVPALATLLAYIILGESAGFWGWFGVISVSLGILLIVRQKG